MKKLRSMNDLMQTVPEATVPFRMIPPRPGGIGNAQRDLDELNRLLEESDRADQAAKNINKKPAKKPKAVTQQQLVVQLPAETIKALKQAALDQETSVRAMLLKALSGAGYPVPAGQDEDRRKAK